ncbi:MAG: hypothetical protein LH606_11115 [Cytophagaceae bacterium]|nr:hypothetical protein [Cytophagaceae bacterium]
MSELDSLIRRIADAQSDGTPTYRKGLFPNWRRHRWLPYRRADTNVFCTAITLFTLRQIRERLSPEAQKIVESITRFGQDTYPAYRNPRGEPTYNNYETRLGGHFQNGTFFHRFRHFKLPDDIDDTALIYLTNPSLDQTDVLTLKELLPNHANGTQRWVKNTLPAYRHLRAYSTWFGQRMNIDLDVCALSNLFLLIFRENLPLNRFDEDSLAFIRQVVLSDEYHHRPFDVSHHYPRPALIFYHVARLLSACDPSQLSGCREKLLIDGPKLLEENLQFFDRVIISTSLLKLGASVPVLTRPIDFENELNRYAFFVGCMLTPFEQPAWLYSLAHYPITHFHWVCPAHSLTLWAEYLSLRVF